MGANWCQKLLDCQTRLLDFGDWMLLIRSDFEVLHWGVSLRRFDEGASKCLRSHLKMRVVERLAYVTASPLNTVQQPVCSQCVYSAQLVCIPSDTGPVCIHCLCTQSTRANSLITGRSLAPRSEGARMFQREGVKTTSIAREVVSTVYGGKLRGDSLVSYRWGHQEVNSCLSR